MTDRGRPSHARRPQAQHPPPAHHPPRAKVNGTPSIRSPALIGDGHARTDSPV